MKTAKDWHKTADEFEALSEDDKADMIAFTRVNLQMAAWEAQEQDRLMEQT